MSNFWKPKSRKIAVKTKNIKTEWFYKNWVLYEKSRISRDSTVLKKSIIPKSPALRFAGLINSIDATKNHK